MTEMITGGYILTRSEPIPDHLTKYNLLPQMLLSASTCITKDLGIAEWAGGNPEALGVPASKLDIVRKWAEAEHDRLFGFPNIFYTLQNARSYVTEFIPDVPDNLTILCIALPHDSANEFITEDVAKYGVYQTLERMEQPAAGGTSLGFELLSFGYGIEHTWLCYNFHDEAYEKHDIKPNEYGFLDSESYAQLIIDSIARLYPNTQYERWFPWQIIQYEIK